MKTLLLAALALTSASAHADGFKCADSAREGLNVTVYNHTDASEGTRNAAVMIVSDSNINYGNKTIARFKDSSSTLSSSGASYVANVDLRFNDSSRKGELIGGTKLGQLDQIELDVDFSYGSPVEAGTTVPGTLSLVKRDGDVITIDMDCKRYLKN